MAKPSYIDAEGVRMVDNGDGTVTCGSLEAIAPQLVRRFLKHVDRIVCHTTKRVGKISKTRGATSTRHVFDGGEIVFQQVGGATGNQNPHLIA
jgi:hypothetical protein